MWARLLGCALGCALLLILPGAASAAGGGCPSGTPLWNGGFDTDNLSQYYQYFAANTEPGNRITFSSTTQECNDSARFELRNGDLYTDGHERLQLRNPSTGGFSPGDDRWFRFGVYVDNSTTIDGTMSGPGPWRTLVAWPDTTSGAMSSYHLFLQATNGTAATTGGTASFVFGGDLGDSTAGGNDVDYWSVPATKNTWHDFIVHLKFANTDAGGVAEFYYDDPSNGYGDFVKQGFNATACNSKGDVAGAGCTVLNMRSVDLNSSHTNNLREGIYRNDNFTTTDVIYYDNMRDGTSFTSVGGTVQPPTAFVDDSFTEGNPQTFVEDTFS